MICTRRGDTLHVSLEARLDATTAGALERELLAAVGDGPSRIVVDASDSPSSRVRASGCS